MAGLSSLTWRRVTYTVHFPFADVHLFTIGKDSGGLVVHLGVPK